MSNLEIESFDVEKNYTLKKGKTGYPSIDKTHEKADSFLKKHPVIPNVNIYNALSLMSGFYRKANALNCLDLNVSYQELLDNSKTLAKAYKELGIKSGDIITVSMPNISQGVTAFLAANKIGATTTFLNPGSSIEEVEHYLNLFESPVFINFDKDQEYNEQIKKNTRVKNTITVNKEDLKLSKFSNEKISTYNDYLNYRDLKTIGSLYNKNLPLNFSSKQDALILFTSGSTGNPKSVVLTNKNLLSAGTYLKNSSNVKSEVGEKTLVCVPFCYPYGFATSTLMSLLCGREAILAPDISEDKINYYLEKNPNMIFGSPALLEMIRKNTRDDLDLSSVTTFISGGDFLTPERAKAGLDFFKNHNSEIILSNGSGNAETCGSGTNPVGVELRSETVGKVLTGSSAIVVDSESLEELKYNEEGQLCISGGHVFKEYYGEPELTEDSKFTYKGKEYFKTGTRGTLDEDGYFTLTGRDSRFYITSTLNKVYCDHVQSVISKIDEVEDCAVVQKPDEDKLFVNKAYIVLKQDVLPTEEEKEKIISQFSKQFVDNKTGEVYQLKEYEIPEEVEIVDELPRTRADKIDYKLSEEKAIEKPKMKVK